MVAIEKKENISEEHISYEAEHHKIIIYAATNYYINVSQSFLEIAEAVKVPQDVIVKWSKTEMWQEALEFWGFTGQEPPRRRLIKAGPPKVPYTVTERYLLEMAFQADGDDVRFVTYKGFIDSKVESVETYRILLADGIILNKHDILFAFPKRKMSALKFGIKRRRKITDLRLPVIVRKTDRPHVPVRAKSGDFVECVMRNGLVITGQNIWTSKYNIVLRVRAIAGDSQGKVVLIYRHALLHFKVLAPKPHPQIDSKDDWDDE